MEFLWEFFKNFDQNSMQFNFDQMSGNLMKNFNSEVPIK